MGAQGQARGGAPCCAAALGTQVVCMETRTPDPPVFGFPFPHPGTLVYQIDQIISTPPVAFAKHGALARLIARAGTWSSASAVTRPYPPAAERRLGQSRPGSMSTMGSSNAWNCPSSSKDAPRCGRGTGLADRTASPKQIPSPRNREGMAPERIFSLIFPPSRPIFPVICLAVCRAFVVWTQATDGSAVDGHAVTPTRSSSPPSAGHASIFLGNSTGPRLAQSSQLPHAQSSFSPAGRPRSWAAGFKHLGMPAPAALPPPAQT